MPHRASRYPPDGASVFAGHLCGWKHGPRSETIPGVTTAEGVSLEGRIFRVAEMGAAGEASAATVFEYHEDEDLVWARYEGGAVRLGFLVGVREGDRIEFRYSQLNENGESSNGRCSSTISILDDGRVRLSETWAWESRPGQGTSAVEEIRGPRGHH